MDNYYQKYITYKKKYLSLKGGSKTLSRIKSCMWGLLVGDALGSRYEFLDSSEAQEKIKMDLKNVKKLEMLGGGPFDLLPGQITDDSEMAISLLKSLFDTKRYSQQDVAKKYIAWYKTDPVDIGATIKKAIETRKLAKDNKDMIDNSLALNMTSLSNGVLMRIAPLGIYGTKITDIELRECVNQECSLTHPNKIIKDAAYIYCIAIKYLILGKSKQEVFDMCYGLTETPRIRINLTDSQMKPEPTYIISKDDNEEKFVNTDNKQYQGYVGIALQNAFYELLNGKSYYDSMINIIKRGGDTDTNCCIAGALLGAYYNDIDSNWINAVKDVDRGVSEISPSQVNSYLKVFYK